MSRPDLSSSPEGALAPLIAAMKQKPVQTDFEAASEWIMAGGAVVTAVAVIVALPALFDPTFKAAVRAFVLLAGVSGILILLAGLCLWVLGSLTTLRRYSAILSDNLEQRFRMATVLAEELAATVSRKEIGSRLRHVRLEIRMAERMALKASAASAIVSAFLGLSPALAVETVTTNLVETLVMVVSGAGLGAVFAWALTLGFADRLIRAEHVLVEAELISGVRQKPRARSVHRRLRPRPG